LVENLIDQDFPTVQANRRLRADKGDSIILDHAYGVYMAVNHLIRLGYRRIGMIRGSRQASTAENEFRGYQEALKDRNVEFDTDIIGEGDFSEETGYRWTKHLMSLDHPPDAIYCGDDYVAWGSMKALAELNLRVPEDVALIGFDDVELASHPLIQLTTVRGNIEEMGRLVVKHLLERIENSTKPYRQIVLEPHLIIRRSCGYQNVKRETTISDLILNRTG
jgi:LacI family transcriptional regulator